MPSLRYLKLHGNPTLKTFNNAIFGGTTIPRRATTDSYSMCCQLRDFGVPKCTPGSPNQSDCEKLLGSNNAFDVLAWLMGILSVGGNLWVIIWRSVKDRENATIFSILARNMAVSDLLMGAYLIIIAIADTILLRPYYKADLDWRSGHFCRIAGTLSGMAWCGMLLQ